MINFIITSVMNVSYNHRIIYVEYCTVKVYLHINNMIL